MASATETGPGEVGLRKPAGTRQATWSPLVVFRPPLPHCGDAVILSDAWHCKRLAVNRQALLGLLTDQFLQVSRQSPLAQELEERILLGDKAVDIGSRSKAHLNHWWARGWNPTLEYYLWSRHNNFFDAYDPTGKQRREAIQTYLEQGEPPTRLVPEGAEFALPQPAPLPSNITLKQLLLKRRTIRWYVEKSVPERVFSAVLWFGCDQARHARGGPTDDPIHYLRSFGVAFDVFVVIYSVENLEPGVYYYDLLQHAVVRVSQGDYRQQMVHNIFEHSSPETAAWTIVFVADVAQYQWRYRHERALRHLYFEAGRLGQRLLLAGMAFGLGTLSTPAIRDRRLASLLQVDGTRHIPTYTLTMGLDRRFHRSEPA